VNGMPSWLPAILTGVILSEFGSAGDLRAAPSAAPAAEVEALITDLGDPDYAVRETASGKLAALGMKAADALLTAAETSPDLEVALRARWLAESLPLVVEGDAEEAARLLQGFAGRRFADRVTAMHRLLRLDDDAGIEPLARIVQLERTAAGSRIAAALLVREWQPDDPHWPRVARRIVASLGTSRRPAARFLQAVIAYSTAATAATAAAAVDEAVAAAATMALGQGEADEPVGLSEGEAVGISRTGRIFRRHLAWLLARSGRLEEALAEARGIIQAAGEEADPDEQLAAELEWFASHGLPEAVDLVADKLAGPDLSPLVAYAAALAWQNRNEPDAAARAAALADAAEQRLDEAGGLTERLTTAMLLTRWGAREWGLREYRKILDDPEANPSQRALAAILCSEFLHEQRQDADAAAVLASILEPDAAVMERVLTQLERDPRAVRSRMLFFQASAEADPAARRRLLEESLQTYAKDVDALIALYRLADNTPAQQAEAAARVARAAAGIEAEIAALPWESSGKNEYAWLVANTEGDLVKATRFSRQSLEESFNNASYLDTLAHCHAAAGNLERAIRTQWIAVKTEPHSLLLRLNYERFLARAAATAADSAP